ncbi:hypothetical protein C0431_13270 [bacterium]|nr:hypothetical protein [bacterium]
MDQANIHVYFVILDTYVELLADKSFLDSQSVNTITRMKAKLKWLKENELMIIQTYDWSGYLGMFDNLFDSDGHLYAHMTSLRLLRERGGDKTATEYYDLLRTMVGAKLNASGQSEGTFKLTPRMKAVVIEPHVQESKPYIPPEALSNSSYSGADMVATIQMPGGRAQVLGELASINYSVYREKTLVRALGSVRPKGVTRGQRTISGILEFVNFDRSVAYKLLSEYYDMGYHVLMDELPQFDITITMANETGQRSVFRLYGISTFTEGSMMSIDQIMTRSSYEFYALDIDPMAPLNFKKGVKIGGVSG